MNTEKTRLYEIVKSRNLLLLKRIVRERDFIALGELQHALWEAMFLWDHESQERIKELVGTLCEAGAKTNDLNWLEFFVSWTEAFGKLIDHDNPVLLEYKRAIAAQKTRTPAITN